MSDVVGEIGRGGRLELISVVFFIHAAIAATVGVKHMQRIIDDDMLTRSGLPVNTRSDGWRGADLQFAYIPAIVNWLLIRACLLEKLRVVLQCPSVALFKSHDSGPLQENVSNMTLPHLHFPPL